MSDIYSRLRAKGWTKSDIDSALKIIAKAKTKKSTKIRFLDAIIYWFVLIIAIFGNLLISIALVPFLLEFSNVFLYVIIGTFALIFGALFDLLIRDIETLEQKHVIIAGIFIPALAIINIFYTTRFANFVSEELRLNNPHNPILISIIYVVAFITPYVVYRIVNKKSFF